MKILDVGCGMHPRGNINVDTRVKENPEIDQLHEYEMKIDEIENFVRADGCHLPFRDAVFDLVLAIHVIEHTATPKQFVKELLRVSQRYVWVECPHRFSHVAKLPYHRSHVFSKTWFSKRLLPLKYHFEVDYILTFAPIRPFKLFSFLQKKFKVRPVLPTLYLKVWIDKTRQLSKGTGECS
jgi:ubiquinone/menaquinone biosynthesis C-methylase UbiE